MEDLIMPTIKRVWYPGAMYHITARGNHKSYIFEDNRDFKYYIRLIQEALEYYNYEEYEVVCYCLMGNHVHILLKANCRPAGAFICRLNSKYAKYYNKKYNCVGHLFQGRYHSKLIKNELQLIETSRYIHLNPVTANIVKAPDQYKWSSYPMYVGRKKESIIKTESILSYFDNRKEYISYIESAIKITPGV